MAAFLAAHDAGSDVRLASSGSSGFPRAVVRTTRSWVDSFSTVAGLCGLGPDSRAWVPGPLSATMNLFAAVLASHVGASVVDSAADATHAFVTPTTLRRSLTELAGRTVVVAGDRLPRDLADRAREAGAEVHHYYGAAELSFVAWGGDADDLRPFPGVEVEVRDGEIWVRTPYLFIRYDGPPGVLRRAADGLVTVGDRGAFADGRLVVHGRPEAVTTGGTTVLVSDVEAELRPHARSEVVVVGVPHAELGQVLAVVLGDDADRPAVQAAAREHLDGAHRPRLWLHEPDLPLTDAGKVDRAAVARLAAERRH